MSFSVAFIVALALTGAVVVNANPTERTSELHKVFKEFLHLVPLPEVKRIAARYLENDEEVKAVAKFMKSERYRQLVNEIARIDAVRKLVMYLHEAGLYRDTEVMEINGTSGMAAFLSEASASAVQPKGGVAGLIEDVGSVLPVDEMKDLYREKLKSSPAFRRFVDYLKAPRFQELVDEVADNETIKRLRRLAKKHGVDWVLRKIFRSFNVRFPLHPISDDDALLRNPFESE